VPGADSTYTNGGLGTKRGQDDLAWNAHIGQSAVSRSALAQGAVTSEEILYPSYTLDKPIVHFFPKEFRNEFEEGELTTLQKELILHARQLSGDDLRKLIAQVKAVADPRK